MPDDHSCFGKAREIRRRTGIFLGLDTHSVIDQLCREWGAANADEFYEKMNGMSDKDLEWWVQLVWAKVKKKKGMAGLAEKMDEELINTYA